MENNKEMLDALLKVQKWLKYGNEFESSVNADVNAAIENYNPSVIAIIPDLDAYYQECEQTLKLIKEAVDNAVSNGKYTVTELGIQTRINKLNKLKPKN